MINTGYQLNTRLRSVESLKKVDHSFLFFLKVSRTPYLPGWACDVTSVLRPSVLSNVLKFSNVLEAFILPGDHRVDVLQLTVEFSPQFIDII